MIRHAGFCRFSPLRNDLREFRQLPRTLCFEKRLSGSDGNRGGSYRTPRGTVSNSRTLTLSPVEGVNNALPLGTPLVTLFELPLPW